VTHAVRARAISRPSLSHDSVQEPLTPGSFQLCFDPQAVAAHGFAAELDLQLGEGAPESDILR
jgi:hypothetical protein